MATYTTEVIINVSRTEENLPATEKADFSRIMDLPFNPYTARGQPFGFDVNGEGLSAKVSNAKWSEARPPTAKTGISPPPYIMRITLVARNKTTFEFIAGQLKTRDTVKLDNVLSGASNGFSERKGHFLFYKYYRFIPFS